MVSSADDHVGLRLRRLLLLLWWALAILHPMTVDAAVAALAFSPWRAHGDQFDQPHGTAWLRRRLAL